MKWHTCMILSVSCGVPGFGLSPLVTFPGEATRRGRIIVADQGSVFYGTVMFGCYVKEGYALSELAQHTVDISLQGIRAESATRNG